MIKNIIFDIGMVLVNFNWKKCLNEFDFSEQTKADLGNAFFLNPNWIECDRGALSDEQLLENFIHIAPQYKKELCTLFSSLSGCITQYEYTIPWLQSLKAKGFGLYFLSNYSENLYRQTREALNFVELLDGGIFSFEVKLIKPDLKIYQTILNRYHLNPQETLFVDDNLDNIRGAARAGLQTLHFTGYEEAAAEMKKLDI